jgi:hypothetical protein
LRTRAADVRKAKSMKISSPVALVLMLVASTFSSQHSIANEDSMRATDCTVARIAERYIAIRYPDFDSVKNPPIVRDRGDSWQVEYELPKGVIGGTPIVVIEKTTLRVLRSFQTQ